MCACMDKLTALWQGASYQDKLLQSYRNLNIALQSVFLLVGSGFTIAVLAFGDYTEAWLSYTLLMLITVVANYFLCKIKSLIMARSEDVNYFHSQIVEYEKSLPKSEQVLTAFKVYQKFGRTNPNPDEHFLTFQLDDFTRKQLFEKDKGHTRQILDHRLFLGFHLLWIGFHLIGILSIITHLPGNP